MKFLYVVEEVKTQIEAYSLQQKISLFKEVLNYPIDFRDGVFYVFGSPYDEDRMRDYLKIREHWMSMKEFDKLFMYFENTEDNK